jgi:ferredoxin
MKESHKEPIMPNFEVSIIQEECTSCGLCPEVAGKYFFMGDDNLAYVKEENIADPDEPGIFGLMGKVAVGEAHENAVIEAAESCPGECIYLHPIMALA